jgi:hypothetical protein
MDKTSIIQPTPISQTTDEQRKALERTKAYIPGDNTREVMNAMVAALRLGSLAVMPGTLDGKRVMVMGIATRHEPNDADGLGSVKFSPLGVLATVEMVQTGALKPVGNSAEEPVAAIAFPKMADGNADPIAQLLQRAIASGNVRVMQPGDDIFGGDGEGCGDPDCPNCNPQPEDEATVKAEAQAPKLAPDGSLLQ